MGNLSISVIIPVYNMEKYLSKCLESVINQSVDDIEIIVINDGSMDNSLNIIKSFKKKDSRIKIIDQMNMGCAIAKNNGFNKAIGEFIVYIDSDDYILKNGLNALLKEARLHTLDIVIPFPKHYLNNKKIKYDKNTYIIKNGEKYLVEQLLNKNHYILTTAILFRRKFLLDYHISYPEGLIHEDIYYYLISIYYAKSIKNININYYRITENPNSITRNKNRTQNGYDIYEICLMLEKEFKKCLNTQLKILVYDYLARLYLYSVDLGNIYNKKTHKRFLLKKAYFWDTKIKVTLFLINKYLYKIVKTILGKRL